MIKIDYRDARPIYEQVVDGIEGLALRGALPADTQLPQQDGEILYRTMQRHCVPRGLTNWVSRLPHWPVRRARSGRPRSRCAAG